jgi:hypothetical protein
MPSLISPQERWLANENGANCRDSGPNAQLPGKLPKMPFVNVITNVIGAGMRRLRPPLLVADADGKSLSAARWL